MNDLDYAIQRMRDAIDTLADSDDPAETLSEIAGGLADAHDALGIPQDDEPAPAADVNANLDRLAAAIDGLKR